MNQALRTTASGGADRMRDAADARLPLRVVDRSEGAGQLAPPPRGGRIRRLVRRAWLIPLFAVTLAAGGVIGLTVQPPGLQVLMRLLDLEPGSATRHPIAVPVGRSSSGTEALSPTPAAGAGARTVVALGTLVPEGEVITIAPPYGAGDARIASLEVDEGDKVAVGDLLAVLDSEPQFLAALEAARANVAVLEATLAERRAAIHASREEAAAALARAQSAAENAGRELDRGEALLTRKVISEAVIDERRASAQQARRDVDRAAATLSRYQAEAIDDQPDVVVAARNLDAARAHLAEARADLEKARIRAPIAGTVLKIHVRPGERPGEGGIMNIADIDRMTAEVEVYQTDIAAVALGDAVTITSPALPGSLEGRVSRIGLEVGRQSVVAGDPAANTDARVIEVRVALDPRSSAIASRYTNLQVTARIAAGEE